MTNVSNYVEDTTFHACDSNLESLIQRLEHDSVLAIEWFESNYMKLNNDKCHLLLSGYRHEVMLARVKYGVMMMMNCFVVWLTEERHLALFPTGPLSETLTIVNLQHAVSRV